MTGGALERRAVLHERDFGLAVRARQDFEQFIVDSHAGEYMTPSSFCGTIH
jgi:hypothetical protein